MLKDRIKGKRLTLLAFTLLATGASMPSAPAIAGGDCETQARRRCIEHWPQNFPQYATYEDCVEGEVALGNCYMRKTGFWPGADRQRLPYNGERPRTA